VSELWSRCFFKEQNNSYKLIHIHAGADKKRQVNNLIKCGELGIQIGWLLELK
jgi:hypothetical protein